MIRKDDILKMTEKGISVFRYYLPVDFKVGQNTLIVVGSVRCV